MPFTSELTARQLVENIRASLAKSLVSWLIPVFEAWETERDRLAVESAAAVQRAYEADWDEFGLTDLDDPKFKYMNHSDTDGHSRSSIRAGLRPGWSGLWLCCAIFLQGPR
jgi:hypothetical protein